MTERKRSKAEERAYAELEPALLELKRLRLDMRIDYELLQMETIPPDWHRVEDAVPVRPKRVRINASYDEDVARFFRAMGQGYQARMNAVLRAYMLAVKARVIESQRNLDWKGQAI